MLRILLVTTRPEALGAFHDYLSKDTDVSLQLAGSGADAVRLARSGSPQLVIIDHELPDTSSLKLVSELLMVDAMINTAVVSPLSEEEFHEAAEGLGVLAGLPLMPGADDAAELLIKLRNIMGSMPDCVNLPA